MVTFLLHRVLCFYDKSFKILIITYLEMSDIVIADRRKLTNWNRHTNKTSQGTLLQEF